MDYFYEMVEMNYFYNNIFNNAGCLDLDTFSYINNASYINKVNLGDIIPGRIEKKKKKSFGNIDVKVNNLYGFYNNNFIRNPYQFNNNYLDKIENKNNLNPNLFRTANNFYGKYDIYNPIETFNPYQNKLPNNPHIHQKIYLEKKVTNKITNKNTNKNMINQNNKKTNKAIKKNQNMNTKMNNNNFSLLNKNNNNSFHPFTNIVQNKQFKPITKNHKNKNLINNKEVPNNQSNLKKNTKQERKIREIRGKTIENDEDESLSSLADYLLGVCAKINNEERSSGSKPNKKPENENNNDSNSESRKIFKKNFSNFIVREISININKDKIIEFDINLNKKIEDTKENKNQNVINNAFSSNKNKDDNNIKENRNFQSEKDGNSNKDKDLISSTNSNVNIEDIKISVNPKIKIDDNNLGEKYIESGDVKIKEIKNKKDRRVTIEKEDKNVYFKFLKDGIINACQVKKGLSGDWEPFKPKKEEDIFDSRIVFNYKSIIKKFDKNEIKIDKDYKYRENMEEREILPDFYDDEEKAEIIDEAINELAGSLRSSIDKSTDASKNDELLRSSINYSYNQSLRNSLMTSNNNEGQGIINKLKAAFEASLNHEL